MDTVAGAGIKGHLDGCCSQAQFRESQGITMDSVGNLYVADSWNCRIRKNLPKWNGYYSSQEVVILGA